MVDRASCCGRRRGVAGAVSPVAAGVRRPPPRHPWLVGLPAAPGPAKPPSYSTRPSAGQGRVGDATPNRHRRRRAGGAGRRHSATPVAALGAGPGRVRPLGAAAGRSLSLRQRRLAVARRHAGGSRELRRLRRALGSDRAGPSQDHRGSLRAPEPAARVHGAADRRSLRERDGRDAPRAARRVGDPARAPADRRDPLRARRRGRGRLPRVDRSRRSVRRIGRDRSAQSRRAGGPHQPGGHAPSRSRVLPERRRRAGGGPRQISAVPCADLRARRTGGPGRRRARGAGARDGAGADPVDRSRHPQLQRDLHAIHAAPARGGDAWFRLGGLGEAAGHRSIAGGDPRAAVILQGVRGDGARRAGLHVAGVAGGALRHGGGAVSQRAIRPGALRLLRRGRHRPGAAAHPLEARRQHGERLPRRRARQALRREALSAGGAGPRPEDPRERDRGLSRGAARRRLAESAGQARGAGKAVGALDRRRLPGPVARLQRAGRSSPTIFLGTGSARCDSRARRVSATSPARPAASGCSRRRRSTRTTAPRPTRW